TPRRHGPCGAVLGAGRAMPTLEVGRGAGTLHCSPTWLRTGVRTGPDTLQRAKAERSRAKELRQPLGHNRDQLRITLDHSTALLSMHATTRNDGATPARATHGAASPTTTAPT